MVEPAPDFAIGPIGTDSISTGTIGTALPMKQTINTAFLLDGILWSKKLSDQDNTWPNTSAQRGDGAQAPAAQSSYLRTLGRLASERRVDQPPALTELVQRTLQPPHIVSRELCRGRTRHGIGRAWGLRHLWRLWRLQ
jgi:hypothetical protein